MEYRDLLAYEDEVKTIAARAIEIADRGATLDDLNPTPDACKFCRAAATCRAKTNKVIELVTGELDDVADATPEKIKAGIERVKTIGVEELGKLYPLLKLIDGFADAVLARILAEWREGRTVPGTKVIAGKRGARKWIDEAKVEAVLKGMRLKQDEMYNKKLISPTDAEELLAKDNPKRWETLKSLYSQSEGNPSVAPISSKAPALKAQSYEDDLADDVTEELA